MAAGKLLPFFSFTAGQPLLQRVLTVRGTQAICPTGMYWEPSITARTRCDSHTHPQQSRYKSFLNMKAHMGTQKWDQQSLELPTT